MLLRIQNFEDSNGNFKSTLYINNVRKKTVGISHSTKIYFQTQYASDQH